jgi:hypothetical protein
VSPVKPFGKAGRRPRGLTPLLVASLALVGAAPLVCAAAWPLARRVPTLARNPFLLPAFLGFLAFFAVAAALWFKRRPSPRGPGQSSRAGLLFSRLLLGALLGVAPALLCAFCYSPLLTALNGLGSGSETVEHALVARDGAGFVLSGPHWRDGARWIPGDVPKNLAPGSLARLRVRSGLFVDWVQSVEYTVLP